MEKPLFVTDLCCRPARGAAGAYPDCLPPVKWLCGHTLSFTAPVTFLVGENGSGKSTLLEALAVAVGFNPEGGGRNFNFSTKDTHSGLYQRLVVTRSWRRPKDGYFLRAESFYNLETEMEELDALPAAAPPISAAYGGRPLHERSHGESFLDLFCNRLGDDGLYLLDEPEAALSVTGQLALLRRMKQLIEMGSQLVIATHSPLLVAYPGAAIWLADETGLREISYDAAPAVALTRRFLTDPAGFLTQLFADTDA